MLHLATDILIDVLAAVAGVFFLGLLGYLLATALIRLFINPAEPEQPESDPWFWRTEPPTRRPGAHRRRQP